MLLQRLLRLFPRQFKPTNIPGCKLWLDASNNIRVLSGNAAQFVAPNSESLSIADNAALSIALEDFTVVAWVYADDTTGIKWVLSKGGGAPNGKGYGIYRDATTFKGQINDGVATTLTAVSGTITSGTWYLVIFQVDRDGNGTMYVNDVAGTPVDFSSFSAVSLDDTGVFRLGAYQSGIVFFDGREQYVGVFKRLLTAAERTFLYNNGNGRQFVKLGIAGTDGSNLIAGASNGVGWWDLGEESGARADRFGSNTLTDNNTVTQNDGVSLKYPQNNDYVRQWTDLSGNGNNFTQTGNVTKKPIFKTAIINGKPVIRFDGTNDILTAANFDSSTEGTLFVVFKLAATTNGQHLFASNDEATATFLFNCAVRLDVTDTGLYYQQRNNDTLDRIAGGSTIGTSVFQIVMFQSNSSALTLAINGTNETLTVRSGVNNGDWVGDTTARDNFSIGAAKTTTEANFLNGDIAELVYYNRALNVGELSMLTKYLGRKYGIVVS